MPRVGKLCNPPNWLASQLSVILKASRAEPVDLVFPNAFCFWECEFGIWESVFCVIGYCCMGHTGWVLMAWSQKSQSVQSTEVTISVVKITKSQIVNNVNINHQVPLGAKDGVSWTTTTATTEIAKLRQMKQQQQWLEYFAWKLDFPLFCNKIVCLICLGGIFALYYIQYFGILQNKTAARWIGCDLLHKFILIPTNSSSQFEEFSQDIDFWTVWFLQ